jgi:hypothetical protein
MGFNIIKTSQILKAEMVCPYCMKPAYSKLLCCGEASGHFEVAVTTEHGLFLLSEITVINDSEEK